MDPSSSDYIQLSTHADRARRLPTMFFAADAADPWLR
jgi:hypothetical protein